MKDVNIGFIGLGNVGSKIASNILKGGLKLFVNDFGELKLSRVTNCFKG